MAEKLDFDFLSQTEWRGFFSFDGAALVSSLHPSTISISESSIDFTYTVGGQAVSRSYGLTRNGSKRITAFTNPDGTVTEVVRNG